MCRWTLGRRSRLRANLKDMSKKLFNSESLAARLGCSSKTVQRWCWRLWIKPMTVGTRIVMILTDEQARKIGEAVKTRGASEGRARRSSGERKHHYEK